LKLSCCVPATEHSLSLDCPKRCIIRPGRDHPDHPDHRGAAHRLPAVAQTAELTVEEQRVLGCLIEKGAITPESYPLTMNALIAACNQTSNRDPVVSYREDTVTGALTSLRERKLIRIVYPAHARATKYRHVLDEVWALSPQELAVLAVLLLRGGQTQNELTARTERYGAVSDLNDLGGIPGILERLAGRPEALAQLVERRPGHREDRYVHLLGPTEVGEGPGGTDGSDGSDGSGPSSARSASISERILALEADTANLRRELASLRHELGDLLGEPNPPPESRHD
jgi:uncharacterized protein YceH (UPF0502 family)